MNIRSITFTLATYQSIERNFRKLTNAHGYTHLRYLENSKASYLINRVQ